jgi:translation initiation factor 3 subunit L
MVHIAESRVGRKFGEWFMRQGIRMNQTLNSIKSKPLPIASEATLAAAAAAQQAAANAQGAAGAAERGAPAGRGGRGGKSGGAPAWGGAAQRTAAA